MSFFYNSFRLTKQELKMSQQKSKRKKIINVKENCFIILFMSDIFFMKKLKLWLKTNCLKLGPAQVICRVFEILDISMHIYV